MGAERMTTSGLVPFRSFPCSSEGVKTRPEWLQIMRVPQAEKGKPDEYIYIYRFTTAAVPGTHRIPGTWLMARS